MKNVMDVAGYGSPAVFLDVFVAAHEVGGRTVLEGDRTVRVILHGGNMAFVGGLEYGRRGRAHLASGFACAWKLWQGTFRSHCVLSTPVE